MKKYIIVLGTFVFLMFSLVVVDKLFLSPKQDSVKTESENTSKIPVSEVNSQQVIVHEVTDVTEAKDVIPAEANVKMDAVLYQSDWENRKKAGIYADNLQAVMKSMVGNYAYDVMDEELHQLYAEIYLILSQRLEDIALCSISDEDIDYAYNCVMTDHPEIFYSQGYIYTKHTYVKKLQKLTFSGNYTYSLQEITQLSFELERASRECLDGIDAHAGDYEKVKYIYDYIITTTEYNINAKDNQAITSVLLYHESVCQGYAKTLQYLLNKVGVECTFVTGNVSGEGHSWNMVSIDNAYYLIDATWGDASYVTDIESKESIVAISYNYFCITSQEMAKTHQEQNIVPLPQCVATDANYYVHEGVFFTSVDEDALKIAFDNAYINNSDSVMIKCSDEVVFYQMKQRLMDEQKIFDFLDDDAETLTYTYDTQQFTFTFLVHNKLPNS